MAQTDQEKLKYPIGLYAPPMVISEKEVDQWIEEIATLPKLVRNAVSGLTDEQLDTPYRPGGWTVRQVVHHIPDSHLNSYVRFKWTLTEDTPTIKAYYEDRWAELGEARNAPIEPSLKLLEALHARWVLMLKTLTEDDLQKKFIHPETNTEVLIGWNIGNYAWHGKHHLAHITELKNRMGWH